MEYNEKIVYVGNREASDSLSCLLAGVTYPDPDYRISRNPCDVYVFEYVVSGEGYIESHGEKIHVQTGDFYCIRKDADEIHYSSPTNPYEKLWVNLDGEIVGRLYDFFALPPVFKAEVNVMNQFLEMHDKLERMTDENESDTLADLTGILFSVMLKATKEQLFPSKAGVHSLDEKIRAYIDNNIYNDISLDDISEEFGITKMHVIRVFKLKYGTTPVQYMLERKISIAKSLLTGTVMPIKEIASLLRYSNTQHFSGSFKKAVGCTPNRYRKSK